MILLTFWDTAVKGSFESAWAESKDFLLALEEPPNDIHRGDMRLDLRGQCTWCTVSAVSTIATLSANAFSRWFGEAEFVCAMIKSKVLQWDV